MTQKRNIGSIAAAAGLAVSVIWLTAPPAARADELSDLRANMELLQQRMDQLSQALPPVERPGTTGANAYGTTAVPGTNMQGGSFPRSFLIPGTDTSIRVGGIANETIDYYFQGGPPNSTANTTVGVTGNADVAPLNYHAATRIGGFPTKGGLVVPGVGSSTIAASARGNSIFSQSPRESRLNVETRTPTAWGEARTFIEFDFAGCDNFSCNQALNVSDSLVPRLRYAYGTLGGVLAGQANSNFSDPDANPETIDFGGPAGEAGVVRQPQIRYTYAGPFGSAWSVAAESPQTDIITPAGKDTSDGNVGQSSVGPLTAANSFTNGCVANGQVFNQTATSPTFSETSTCALAGNPAVTHAPDLTFSSYWAQPWGHVDFRFLLRDLSMNDGRYVSSNILGYGGGISGDVRPGWFGWAKDDFQWQFTVGNGIGRYLNDGSDAGLATNYTSTPGCATPTAGCSIAATSILIRPIFEAGGTVGYQHWWLSNLRSNAAFGLSTFNVPSTLVGPLEMLQANKQVITAHGNLIWSPVAFIDTGVEYVWARRQVLAGLYGQEQALIGTFRVKF
jgi:Porin subfamily